MARKKPSAPKRGASRQPETTQQPVHPLIWIAAGIALGVFAMVLFQLEPGKDSIKRDASAPAAPTTPAQPIGGSAIKVEEPKTKPKFEFYTILSESEVIVPPEALPEKTPPPPSTQEVEAAKQADAARAQAILDGRQPPPAPPRKEVTQFYLQAGSFPERDKAETVRAQLLLTGQNVHIEPGQVASKTWYRVMVGPFVSREQLNAAQLQLGKSGFNNLLLQQRKARL